MAKCRQCGEEICFVKTPAGKAIPVNTGAVYYVADCNGDATLINSQGEAVRGVVVDGFEKELGDIKICTGRVPHWVSCVNQCTIENQGQEELKIKNERERLREIAAENGRKNRAEKANKSALPAGQQSLF